MTIDIAEKYSNVKIVRGDFIGFGATKNSAIEVAKYDWIFALDADEQPNEALLADIQSIPFSQSSIVYRVNRCNYYRAKAIQHSGWAPDYLIRLFNRQFTKFNNKLVHEAIIIPEAANVVTLKGQLNHYGCNGAEDLIAKMQHYSRLYAESYQGKKKSSISKALVHGSGAFFKTYFLKRGFLDGKEGFIIAAANGISKYYRYIKLMEINNSN
ncbi:Glycosyl transferase family 2 [Suttonella ornithocola]|uniref:Glycosyl transferase family 2 n=1 Tax=Suttonella ornithocola TaxID=279832 RepID=A0A380MUV4_9GAMM|nr:Glycosyl transferase family 2 [Suttonella ornithocola]